MDTDYLSRKKAQKAQGFFNHETHQRHETTMNGYSLLFVCFVYFVVISSVQGDDGGGFICNVSRHSRGEMPLTFLNAMRNRLALA